jgi:hypothetical protein
MESETSIPDHHHGSFRFLDLPGEMRDCVYLHLLTPSQHHLTPYRLTCYPQILATCSQIYSEASDILHQTECVSLVLDLASHHVKGLLETEQPRSVVRLCFNGLALFTAKQGDLDTSMPWPKCLAKLTSIHIELRLSAATRPAELAEYEDGLVQMNWAVHELSALLAGSNCLRNLTILGAASPYISANQAFQYDVVSPIITLCANVRKVTYDEDLDCKRAPGMAPFTRTIRDAVTELSRIRSNGNERLYKAALTPQHIPHGHIYSRDNPEQPLTYTPSLLKFASAQDLSDLMNGNVSQTGAYKGIDIAN